jgi:hypothetical protein
VVDSYYAPNERGLKPPVSLLAWLVRNFDSSADMSGLSEQTRAERQRLAAKDPEAIDRALALLHEGKTDQGWHVLQGRTYPDVLLVTREALIVIEGKRTESGPTGRTTWMASRDQMLRHIDAAWEIKVNRDVYGFFIVEGEGGRSNGVPPKWVHAAVKTISGDTLRSSLPHRSPDEQAQIVECFLGATTWQAIIAEFDLQVELDN